MAFLASRELGGDGPTPSDGGDLQKRTQARAIGLG